jgi:hypothetical protein
LSFLKFRSFPGRKSAVGAVRINLILNPHAVHELNRKEVLKDEL